MGRKLRNQVVVLTGASSGIGRATARRLAADGAALVLAARDVAALGEVVRECEAAGGRAIAVPTDVTDEAAVAELAARAEAAYGRIDAWVNDASVASYGRLEEIPTEEIRRVLDVNVMGYVHGMRAVLPRFRSQGHGVIVNVASLLSAVGSPFMAPYVMSKHAVRGLSDSVRMELRDAPGVHVCSVLPGAIDTPFFQHAANHSGKRIKAPAPTIRPEAVARAIVGCIRRPKRERVVGWSTRALLAQRRSLPGTTERLVGFQMHHDQFRGGAQPEHTGNLFEPRGDDTERGGWRGGVQGAVRRGALAGAAVVAVQAVRKRAA